MTTAALQKPLRNLGWLLGGRGINALFSLAYLALATRNLGLADFGRFSLIVVMAQAITGMASFSAWQMVVRWGAGSGESGPAAGFATALDLASVPAGGLIAVLAVWAAPFWLPLPPDLRIVALGLCLATLFAMRSTPTGVLRLHDRYDLAAGAEAALPATRAAGAVLAALFLPTIAGFALAWGVAELVCAALYWRFAWRIEPLRREDISLTRLPRRHPELWRFVWATSLSRSLAVGSKQVLILLVGAIGGPVIAGGFRVAAQLGQALVQLGEALSRALYPELVREVARAGDLARRMAALALATGGLAVALAALAGERLVSMIAGPGFGFVQGAMVVLALAGSIELLATSADALLVARGKAWRVFVLRAVPLVVALALLAPAIARFGLIGAAACVLLASAGSAAGLGYSVLARGSRR